MQIDLMEGLEKRTLLTGVSLSPPTLLPSGGSAVNDFALADVNGDSTPDLIAVSPSTNAVSVMLGNGNGTFRPGVTYAAGSDPTAVSVGDVNGDGNADIVVADSGADEISILFGNGNGTFQTAITEPVYGSAKRVAVGDLTGDGRQDIIVGSYNISGNETAFNVFLNTPASGLVAEPVFKIGISDSNRIVLADLTGDGIPALVLPGYGAYGAAVAVLQGNGNGTFAAPVTYATAGDTKSAVVGDFSGNTTPDIAVTNGINGSVGLLVGNGNGTFQAMQTVASGGGTASQYLLGPVDLNGDGKPDLLWANGNNQYAPVVNFLAGNGNGTFAPPQDLGPVSAGRPTVGQLADLTGDGKQDLVVSYYNGLIGVRLNTTVGGNVSFASPIFSSDGASLPKKIAAADLTGDGNTDLVVTNQAAGSISVLLGNGNGTFQLPLTFAAGPDPEDITVGNFTSDGIPDVAVTNDNDDAVSILLGNGNGTFAPPISIPLSSGPSHIVATELTGDGLTDLVVVEDSSDSVAILLGNGNGTFQPPQTYAVGSYAKSLRVVDLTGDGIRDILTANYGDNTISVLLGNGNGTFAPQQTLATGNGPNHMVVTDFTASGFPDIAVANELSGSVGLFLGNGNGTFQPMQTLASNGTTLGDVEAADFNGDGHEDILWISGDTDSSLTADVLLGNGNGTFSAPVKVATVGPDPAGATVADLTGDGKPDVILVYHYSGLIGINLNTSDTAANVTVSGDMLMVSGSTGDDDVSINASGTNVVVNFDGVPVTYSMSSVAGTVINAGAGDDSINIGPGVPPVTVGGAGGNDTIVTASSNDSVRGGGGDDQLVAGASDDTAVGGAGNDTISAGSGSGDQLFGGPGDDFFTNAGGSGDSVDGGAGLNFAADNSADLLTNIFETYDDNPQAATPDLDTVPDSAGGDDLQIFGTSGNDSITLSDNGQGDLVVVENGGSPQMYPQAGITGILLAGGLGNDTLVAESSVLIPVSLRGAAGNDSLVGGGGDNVIVGGAGSDTLVGGEGTNLLVPTRRVAFEDGSADQDVLIGGPAGSVNIADFSHRTDNVYLSNDGMDHGGVTIMPNVLNIFAGSGQDTVVSTSPGSFMSAGTGTDSLVSGGANTILVAGPNGAGEDTVAASGLANSLFLMNGHADEYEGFTDSDFLQDDPSDISI